MKIRIFFLPSLMLFVSIINAQQFGPATDEQLLEKEFWESIQTQGTALDSLMVWQEQVLLHTDKETIAPKDHLFFKAYVLTGPDQLRVSASDVLKVELLDERGTLVNSQYHKISNGSAAGSVMIPKKAKSGKHYLRAYTRWMLNYGPENFATKEVAILDRKNNTSILKNSKPDIKIFPEGGTMIAGLENRVAVRTADFIGDVITVIDGSGNEITKVQDYGNGIGTFLLTPRNGMSYSLKLNNGRKVALPDAGELGYSLQVNNIIGEKVVVKVAATNGVKNQEAYLRGRINGINFFESKVTFKNSNSLEIEIPKTDLPNGIVQLQLEDEFDQVWATRPVHIDNNQLHFEIEKPSDTQGNLVKIKVTDAKGLPVQTELSIALGKAEENSQQPFAFDQPRNQRYLNDLLVLTNRLPNVYALNKATELPTEIKYNFQEGLEFYGRAYDLDAVPLTNTRIQVVISGTGKAMAHEVTTNKEGLFKLSGLQIKGEADMVFRRAAKDQRDKFVNVIPYQYETPPLKIKSSKDNEGLNSKQFIPKKQVAEFKEGENLDRLITLEGVSLVGEKYRSSKTPSVYNIKPTHVVYQDPKRPKFMSELFLNIPGVTVGGGLNFPTVSPLSSSNSLLDQSGPLWIIDGFIVGNSPFLDPEWALSHIDIDRIEFLIRSSEASLWGSRASKGVILIYTRNGSDESYINRKKAQLTFEGYHDSLSFDSYKAQLTGKKIKTANNTIYWNPSLATDKNGEAFITFPTAGEQQAIEVAIKAITPEGKSGSLQTVF
ncbi:MAG: hypothetical protein AAF039_09460 [Bacteroidota bacterium]